MDVAPENAGYGDAGPLMNDYLLTRRGRSGAWVTLAYGRWDWRSTHGTNFENARDHLPFLIRGLSAPLMIYDGNGKRRPVIVWVRCTPYINAGGRDHWAKSVVRCSPAAACERDR